MSGDNGTNFSQPMRQAQAAAHAKVCTAVGDYIQILGRHTHHPEVVLDAALATLVSFFAENGVPLSQLQERVSDAYAITMKCITKGNAKEQAEENEPLFFALKREDGALPDWRRGTRASLRTWAASLPPATRFLVRKETADSEPEEFVTNLEFRH